MSAALVDFLQFLPEYVDQTTNRLPQFLLAIKRLSIQVGEQSFKSFDLLHDRFSFCADVGFLDFQVFQRSVSNFRKLAQATRKLFQNATAPRVSYMLFDEAKICDCFDGAG